MPERRRVDNKTWEAKIRSSMSNRGFQEEDWRNRIKW